MATNYWDEKFFESTRGQIVMLLRRSGRSVEELARAVALTDNGVRGHLAVLERDGVVRQRGSVRRGSGGGKPAYVYELGGLAELEEQYGTLVVRGYGCPLSAVTPDHPEGCRMAEALVAEVAGVQVRECCDRSERPRCCFEVAPASDLTER